jgi:cysteine desulfurase
VVKTPIYLDCQATTPLDKRVLDAMMPYLTEHYGNPHSSTHSFGWRAEAALDAARDTVAGLIGAQPGEIYFTSGATETNNMVIKGVMAKWGAARPKLITVATEHKCVLEAALYCQREGYQLEILPVLPDGLVDLNQLADMVDDKTALVSVMAVNNEIGVIQPLAAIGEIAKNHGALFHSDAAQAFGKIPLDVEALQLDYMSISGHKIYGPKGVGALYQRAGHRRSLVPLLSGGGQEGGVRSGTQSPALVAGLGSAALIAKQEMAADFQHVEALMMSLKAQLFSALPNLILNGHATQRWLGNINVSFPGIDGDLLLASLRDLALSSGAACASAVSGPSYVLEAIGLSAANAKSSLRIGIGRFTSAEEVDFAAERLIAAVNSLGGD